MSFGMVDFVQQLTWLGISYYYLGICIYNDLWDLDPDPATVVTVLIGGFARVGPTSAAAKEVRSK
jgi:4-hydroxybenzoate polyprenyltransferase